MERETIEFDVVIVGAGPAGLAAAIRLRQLAQQEGMELSVCLLEKGAEIGSHILSGAVFESRILDELLPDWRDTGAPVNTPVTEDIAYFFTGPEQALRIPRVMLPRTMHNKGNFIISAGKLCRWLGERAEILGVDVFPGFAAAELRYGSEGQVEGVVTGDRGRNRDGQPKDNFEPGMHILAKYTLFAEGCRGYLGKQLRQHFNLDEGRAPQRYALGIKEHWDIEPSRHHPGRVIHVAGWPLAKTTGGGFLYHLSGGQVAVGLITDLNYQNPSLSPFEEFQRFKHHPEIKRYLQGGKRLSYGARAISKGGLDALPQQNFPGGLLLGCDAGTLDVSRNKGLHTAMKSGMLAAETVFGALLRGEPGGRDLGEYKNTFRQSWLYAELLRSRSYGAALQKFGLWAGTAFNLIDQNFFYGRLPLRSRHTKRDHEQLKPAMECDRINYPKPDGILSFNRSSSVFLSNTHHQEDQPCHLIVKDEAVMEQNLNRYSAPEQHYCPVGVYEIRQDKDDNRPRMQINFQNCIHCKTCDIKASGQNIEWMSPEGGEGPNYCDM